MKFFVAIVMLACAAAASDVPALTPDVQAATDFHNAAHAAAKTVALGGAAPSFFQPDAPDVHFVKQAHLAQLNYETVRNTGYHYGAYPYAFPLHYRKKRQSGGYVNDFHQSSVDLNQDGFPDNQQVYPFAYRALHHYGAYPYAAYGAYPYHY